VTPSDDGLLPLAERVAALMRAAELCGERFPPEEVAHAERVAEKATARLKHGSAHTVVAVAGATGSGKSSIVNRLAGQELSEAGIRRPTTSATHAAVWGAADAGPLLDWLEVGKRHQILDGESELDGLVLLDLPDHDSTAVEHRLEVDRLVEVVDVLVWVTDPQKYADEALHAGYIAKLSAHARVLRFVLNQVDRLDDGGEEVAADLVRLLRIDGIDAPHVVRTSATTGVGFDELRTVIADAVVERRAVVDRLDVDLRTSATALLRTGDADEPERKHRGELIDGLGEAAGANVVAEIAAAQHRRQGGLLMGWPFTRFLRRLARRPLAELTGPGRSSASEPRADLALRDYAEAVSGDLAAPWPAEIRRAAASRRGDLLDELRRSVGSAAVGAGRPARWWAIVAWVQRAFATTALVGLGWLLVVAVLGGFFRFDTEPLLPDAPGVDWAPLPSMLLLGGALAGLLVGFLARFPLGVGAARRARAARKEIAAQVESVADTHVVEPVVGLLAERQKIDELLKIAIG